MKMKQARLHMTLFLLIAVLCFNSAAQALAAEETAAGERDGVSSLGTVSITDSSYFELKDLNILPDSGVKTIGFTISVHNNTGTDLMFADYWVHVLTASGSPVTVRLVPQDKDKNRVAANTALDIGFYATVSNQTELADLTFQFVRFDYSQPDLERKLGEISVGGSYSAVTPAGEGRIVAMSGIPVQTGIRNAQLGQNDISYNVTLDYEMMNAGTTHVAVPDYQFAIRTPEGYMYPLEARNLQGLTIDPQRKAKLALSGTIPVNVSSTGWQLIVIRNDAELKRNFAVAYYELPAFSATDGEDIGKDYTFTSDAGSYTGQLVSVNRIPWEDQDMLIAGVVLSNLGTSALPLPSLTGYYELDDAVRIEDVELIQTDNLVGLAPGASATFQFVGRIPYTYAFSKVRLVMQEKKSDSVTNDVLAFTHSAGMTDVKYTAAGETYSIPHAGRNASYRVRDVRTYQGESSETLMVMLESENREKRSIGVQKLVANFQTPDGTVFPSEVSDITAKVSPGGKALLFLTASLPKGYPMAGMNVMIGEAITGGKLSENGAEPDGYINAVVFGLPMESYAVKDDLLDIDLAPYSLSIHRIRTTINWPSQGPVGELKLIFDYELKKNLMMETNTDGRELVLEFTDDHGNKTFSRKFEFKDFASSAPNDGSLDEKLRLGTMANFEIKETDQGLLYMMQTLDTYTLNIYDSFKGQKKLLASKKIDWFSTTD